MSYTTTQFHASQITTTTESLRVTRKASNRVFAIACFVYLSTAIPSHWTLKIGLMAAASSLVAICVRLDKHLELLAPYADNSVRESAKAHGQFITHAMKPPMRELAIAESPKPIPSHPILKALHGLKLECVLVQELRSPSFHRTLIKPTNCKGAQVLMVGKELQLELGLDKEPVMLISRGAIAIDVPRKDRQIAQFSDYWKPSQKFEMAIGVDINDRLVSVDISQPESCHFLCAGTTGSGKSVLLQGMLLSLLLNHSPDDLQILICDAKRVTFPRFKNSAHLLAPIMYEPVDAIKWLNWLVEEMERRYILFEALGVENIDQYPEKLPRIIFFFDEFGDLKMGCNKSQSKELISLVTRIGQKARAAGIMEGISTQRPKNAIVPQIRANCPTRILLTVKEFDDSEAITGDKSFDGTQLLGRGDLYFDGDRLQALMPSESDFAKIPMGASFMEQPIEVEVSPIEDSPIKAPLIEIFQKIVTFLDGRDWTRDNAIKQSIAELKRLDEPIENIQGYLKLLASEGHIQTRDAGRNGLEAKVLKT